PDIARADQGTWRAQREAKIGTVLRVGPGRYRTKRTAWERDPKKMGPLKPAELERKYDRLSIGALVPMELEPGDRVLFEPTADLRPTGDDPLLRMGVQYQAAAVLTTCEHGRVLCEACDQ